MEPSQFLLDVLTAIVCYVAFTIGGVALIGGIAELVARRREPRE